MDKVEQILKLVASLEGPEGFLLEANKYLDSKEGRFLGRELCIFGVDKYPNYPRLKLLLARFFYLDGLTHFALRELKELKEQYKSETLDRLINSLGGEKEDRVSIETPTKHTNNVLDEGDKKFQELIAEIDLDDDIIEVLDDGEE